MIFHDINHPKGIPTYYGNSLSETITIDHRFTLGIRPSEYGINIMRRDRIGPGPNISPEDIPSLSYFDHLVLNYYGGVGDGYIPCFVFSSQFPSLNVFKLRFDHGFAEETPFFSDRHRAGGRLDGS